jgi:hypothetical protein
MTLWQQRSMLPNTVPPSSPCWDLVVALDSDLFCDSFDANSPGTCVARQDGTSERLPARKLDSVTDVTGMMTNIALLRMIIET